ncbi:hypothetical protein MHH56_14170 [Paenibacillus sp. FSL K6-3182]|uniref:hypothetical protein n=1 Tax=Paenibacillus sp. FSL K6-3182 TaxID=2921495 RepID=UPI0030CEF1EB
MLLKILGWIIAPFLMISIRWKKMNGFSKAIGLVWCLILSIVLIAVNSDPAVEAQKNETVVIPSNVHQPTANQAETTNEQWQASYKQIALNEASAYLELYASQSLSDERLSYAV